MLNTKKGGLAAMDWQVMEWFIGWMQLVMNG